MVISPALAGLRLGNQLHEAGEALPTRFLAQAASSVVTTTDSRGRYRVKLERGRYSVRPVNGRNTGRKQGLQPSTVTVPRGRFAKRDFTYDRGSAERRRAPRRALFEGLPVRAQAGQGFELSTLRKLFVRSRIAGLGFG